jgi:hypothetical protein
MQLRMFDILDIGCEQVDAKRHYASFGLSQDNNPDEETHKRQFICQLACGAREIATVWKLNPSEARWLPDSVRQGVRTVSALAGLV